MIVGDGTDCNHSHDRKQTSGGIKPRAVYFGNYPNTDKNKVGLRISNGAAGQTGLIGAWADSFINYMVQRKNHEPFVVSGTLHLVYDEGYITDSW